MERTLSSTNTRCTKLSTKGALSARSSRQAGLFARSQAISSNEAAPVMRIIVGLGCDIRPADSSRVTGRPLAPDAPEDPVRDRAERVVPHQVGPGRRGALQARGGKVRAVSGDGDHPERLGRLFLYLAEQPTVEPDRFGLKFGQRVEADDERVRALAKRAQVNALAHFGQHGEVVGPGSVQVAEHYLAGSQDERGLAGGAAKLPVPVGAPCRERPQRGVGAQHAVTVFKQELPLVLDQLVVAPGVAVDL